MCLTLLYPYYEQDKELVLKSEYTLAASFVLVLILQIESQCSCEHFCIESGCHDILS